VLRCNPWSVGGVDDVPARGERLFRLHRNNVSQSTGAANAATSPERTLV
jgi:putative component of membrane protein insertase Oxa1/YidC/SpoIIIJ protein YidD